MQIFYKLMLAAMISLVASTSEALAAPTLVFENGKLAGAQGVVIGKLGTFDFSLSKNSCFDAYKGCTANGFLFQTADEALQSSNALFDQVLLGVYNDHPDTVLYGGTNSFNWYIPFSKHLVYSYGTVTDQFGNITHNVSSWYELDIASIINYAAYFTFPDWPPNFHPAGYPDSMTVTTGPSEFYPLDSMYPTGPTFVVWQRHNVPEPTSSALILIGIITLLASKAKPRFSRLA